jgi:hypothetical protein
MAAGGKNADLLVRRNNTFPVLLRDRILPK